MTRNKMLAVMTALSLCTVFPAHANVAAPASIQPTALRVADINSPFNNPTETATSFMEGFAAKYFRSHAVNVNSADADLFAGPYSMFVSEPGAPLSDSSAGGMMLASLGLMALIARRRINM